MHPASGRPFIGSEVIAAGVLTRRTLRHYRRIFHNVYIDPEVQPTSLDLIEAAWLFGGRRSPLAGISAALLHGDKYVSKNAKPELMRMTAGCDGLTVHRFDPPPDELTTVRAMTATTAARTLFDLGRRKGRTEALVRCDMLSHATGLTATDVMPLTARYRGARGIVQLREILELMDNGAESPQETRTRLALLDAGLRRPQTQIHVYDESFYVFARIDMGYEEFKVGIEYDGEQHWTDPKRRAADVERRIMLAERGWSIIHVTSDMLRNRKWLIVQRTIEALRRAGCTWLDECRDTTREIA